MKHNELLFVDVSHQEYPLAKAGESRFDLAGIELGSLAYESTFETGHEARLIALRLKPSYEPRSRVREAFVVEIDRVLGRQDDSQAECARLLKER